MATKTTKVVVVVDVKGWSARKAYIASLGIPVEKYVELRRMTTVIAFLNLNLAINCSLLNCLIKFCLKYNECTIMRDNMVITVTGMTPWRTQHSK
jgi:hypothetical protein